MTEDDARNALEAMSANEFAERLVDAINYVSEHPSEPGKPFWPQAGDSYVVADYPRTEPGAFNVYCGCGTGNCPLFRVRVEKLRDPLKREDGGKPQ